MKKILILGVSGSIGKNTLKIIDKYNSKFKITGISVNKNKKFLYKKIQKYKIKNYVINSENTIIINNKSIKTKKELNAFLAQNTDYDILVNALVGSVGFEATKEAIKKGKTIALANKETIVAYGLIIKKLLKKYKNARIYPIDSEHSALWQLLNSVNKKEVKRIIITASGGVSFKKKTFDLSAKEILSHPVWNMGPKVTVDSSTMVNKGLEIIEASYLFDIDYTKINVLIHPQSIVHALIELNDNTVISHMAYPDMILPIKYALFYPERPKEAMINAIDLITNKLEFYKPDMKKYKALSLAYEVLKKGKTYTAVYSAANEVLVNRFLNNEIKFKDIIRILKKVVKLHKSPKVLSEKTIRESEKWAKETAKRLK